MSQPARHPGVARGFLVIFSWTTLARVTGLLRETLLAFFFGAGRGMDLFVVAFTVPNLFRLVLAEKAIESGFLPTYRTLVVQGREEHARRVASSVLTALTLGALAVVALGQAGLPALVRFLAPGFTPDELSEAVRLTRITFPFLIVISWAAFAGSIHLANRRFIVYATSPLALNGVTIVLVALLAPRIGATGAAVAVLAGGLAQFLIQVPFLARGDEDGRGAFRYRPRLALADPEVRRVGRRMAPVMLEAVLIKSVTVVDRMLASRLTIGAIASLDYSFRLIELPIALLGASMGRSVQTLAAEAHALGRPAEVRAATLSGLRLLAFLALPVTVLAWVLAEPMVTVLYRRGAFDRTAVDMTSLALRYYSLGLFGACGTAVLSRVFYALGETRIPLAGAGLTMGINIGGNFLLYRTSLAQGGLALATSIASTAGFAYLAWRLAVLWRRAGAPLASTELARPLARMAPPLAGMTVVSVAVASLLAGPPGSSFLAELGRLAGVSAAGLAVYLGLARAMGSEETGKLARYLAGWRGEANQR